MKNAMILKSADLIGQVLMLVPPIVLGIGVNHDMFFGLYFTVGGWQALSCLVTRLVQGKTINVARRRYERTLTWVIIVFVVCYFVGGGLQLLDMQLKTGILNGVSAVLLWGYLIEAVVMLVAGPIMAFAYACITWEEIMVLRRNIKLRHELQW
jgi:hypothetical protein